VRATVVAFALVVSGSRGVPDAGSAPGQSHCSRAAADQAILAGHFEAEPGATHPAAQVLCGVPVFGAGVEAMVASVRIPSCGRTGDWLVWRYDVGEWKRVFRSLNGADLVAVGAGIKETQFVLRPGDAHCFPTGGTRSRVWRWNGSRMVAGAWKYSKPQTKRTESLLHVPYFRSPSGNIVCGLGDSGTAHCFSRNPPQSVTLRYDGAVTTCTGRGCFGNSSGPPLPVLGYGKRDEYARYRCTSAMTGITCISLLRGNGYGKGFAISREGVRRVAP